MNDHQGDGSQHTPHAPGQDDFLGEVDVPLHELCGQGLLERGQVDAHYAFGDAQGRLGWSEKLATFGSDPAPNTPPPDHVLASALYTYL